MLQKINKSLDELKIGLVGFRSKFISIALDRYGLSYDIIQVEDISQKYDIILGSGVYNIIPDELLLKPIYGCFFIHESPLPEGRGHAPIQWALQNKKVNFTLSLFKVAPGVDDGYIVYQHNKEILYYDNVESLETKRQEGITECFEIFLNELKQGVIVLREQTGKSTYHKKRNKLNSEIKSIDNLNDLWEKIRICDNEKYPAFFILNDKKITLKYTIDDNR